MWEDLREAQYLYNFSTPTGERDSEKVWRREECSLISLTRWSSLTLICEDEGGINKIKELWIRKFIILGA